MNSGLFESPSIQRCMAKIEAFKMFNRSISSIITWTTANDRAWCSIMGCEFGPFFFRKVVWNRWARMLKIVGQKYCRRRYWPKATFRPRRCYIPISGHEFWAVALHQKYQFPAKKLPLPHKHPFMKQTLLLLLLLSLTASVLAQNTPVQRGFQPKQKEDKPSIKLYQIISLERDTTSVDTTLTIRKYFKYNYLRKTILNCCLFPMWVKPTIPWHTILMTKTLKPLFVAQSHHFNYFEVEDIYYYRVPTFNRAVF